MLIRSTRRPTTFGRHGAPLYALSPILRSSWAGSSGLAVWATWPPRPVVHAESSLGSLASDRLSPIGGTFRRGSRLTPIAGTRVLVPLERGTLLDQVTHGVEIGLRGRR